MRKGTRRLTPPIGVDAAPEHELYMQNLAQRQRGQMRLRLSAAEIDNMVAEFVASRGSVTVCPPAYVCTSRQYHPRQGGQLEWSEPADSDTLLVMPLDAPVMQPPGQPAADRDLGNPA
jgi:hypothetical protein